MKSVKIILIIGFIVGGALCTAQEKKPSAGETSLKDVLKEYLLAWEFKDYEEMYELLPSKTVKEIKRRDFIKKMKATTYFPVEFKVARTKIKAESAKVWIDLYEKIKGDVRKETVSLVRENGKWKVSPLYIYALEKRRLAEGGDASRTAPSASSRTSSAQVSPGGPVSILQDVDTNEILEKMVEAGNSIEDFASRIAITMPMMGFEATLTGTLVFKNPNKARIDLSAPTALNIITNGKMLWIYASAANVVFVNDIGAVQGQENLILGFGGSREELLKEYDATLIGQGSVSGAPAYLLSFSPKRPNERLDIKRIELYVDAQSYIPVKTVAYYADKKISMTFMGITTNTGVEDGLFDFKVPPGVNVSSIPLMDFF